MTLSLNQQIDDAHRDAERIEADARQVEARIVQAGGVPPVRPYGKPVSGEAVGRNLTLKSLLQRRDPALAAFLGVGSDLQRREAEERATREMQAQSLAMQTDRLREVNAASTRYREQQNLAGINPSTGRRWGL
jgi:hypothetical protein